VINGVLAPRSGLEHLAVPGRHGATIGDAGVEVALRTDLALATVMARKGLGDALARRVMDAFGLELPARPRRIPSGPIAFAWAGPGHWLASAGGMDGQAFEAQLRRELADLASVSDQSDGHIVIWVGGPAAREALAKGVMVDLHPRAFALGDAAVTSVAHVTVHFWQLAPTPTYEFAVPRSLAASFWHWLMESSAQYGVTVG
jgi:heterotetrameric sarcosine oxidase gamma subunit